MPNLYIIDDIPDKCDFIPDLVTKLISSAPNEDWAVSHQTAANEGNIEDLIMRIMADQDALLLLDIELKDIRSNCSVAALQQGNLGITEAFNAIWNSLGGLQDYAITCSLLAYCNHHCIPAFVISTRPNDVGRPLHALCLQSPDCVIENWPDSRHVGKIDARAANIAYRIVTQWTTMRGKNPLLRLWPQRILTECWFRDNTSIVPHAYMQTPNNSIREYLNQLLHPKYARPTYDDYFHEALKSLIGVCSRAHDATGPYLPYLSTFALLAALWDCGSIPYLANMQWQKAGCRILPDSAAKEDVISVITDLAAPNGLFDHCLVEKATNTSQVEHVECEDNAVRIKLKWLAPGVKSSKLNADIENLADARSALESALQPSKGESRKALWRVKQSLQSKKALIDVSISDEGELIFRKI